MHSLDSALTPTGQSHFELPHCAPFIPSQSSCPSQLDPRTIYKYVVSIISFLGVCVFYICHYMVCTMNKHGGNEIIAAKMVKIY